MGKGSCGCWGLYFIYTCWCFVCLFDCGFRYLAVCLSLLDVVVGGGSRWLRWFPLSVLVVWLLGLCFRLGKRCFDLVGLVLCIGVDFGCGSCCW